MASSDDVGSFDAWLSRTSLLSWSSSPFASIAVEGRSLKPAQSIPATNSSDCREASTYGLSVLRTSSMSTGMRNMPASLSTSLSHQIEGFVDDCYCSEESTVRNGLLRPTLGPRSDTQPIVRTPSRSSTLQSGAMGTASSLPILGAQTAASLASLCKALSSPASHVTLAATGTYPCSSGCTCWYREEEGKVLPARPQINAELKVRTSDLTTASATTAATAAFNRSMVWTLQQPVLLPPAPLEDMLLPYTDEHHHGSCILELLTRESVSPPTPSSRTASSDVLFIIGGYTPTTLGPVGRASSHPVRAGYMAINDSERRGLVEGTVRGGSPRNCWRYLESRFNPTSNITALPQ